MKIAVVGGGSTYTPELIDGIARLTGGIKVTEVVLVDPDETRLSVGRPGVGPDHGPLRPPGQGQLDQRPGRGPGRRGRRCCCSCGSAGRPPGTATRPGRWSAAASARRQPAPAAWPRRCGPCRWCSTSPSGPGSGPSRTPGSSTSPTRSGIVTRALLDSGHRAIGLCNVAIGFQRRFAGDARRRARARSILDHVGLNHLTWERAVIVDGTDRLPEMLSAHGADDRRSGSGCPGVRAAGNRRGAVVLPAVLLGP